MAIICHNAWLAVGLLATCAFLFACLACWMARGQMLQGLRWLRHGARMGVHTVSSSVPGSIDPQFGQTLAAKRSRFPGTPSISLASGQGMLSLSDIMVTWVRQALHKHGWECCKFLQEKGRQC
jgi:hypothetical protein